MTNTAIIALLQEARVKINGYSTSEGLRLIEEAITGLQARRTPIVCLCGSTRFMEAFHEANRRLSLEGKIVLTVEIVSYDGATDPQRANPEQKKALDELHLRKIDLADEVFVLNVGGYIGESTRKEIEYAIVAGKPISYLV